jgi:hypothetical protein
LTIKNESTLKFDKDDIKLPNVRNIETQLAIKPPESRTVSQQLQVKYDMGKAITEVVK